MSETTESIKVELKQDVGNPSGYSMPTSFMDDPFDDDDLENEKPARPPTHEDNADPIVPPRQVSARPGPMRTQGEIILHTHMAHRLFYGRRYDKKNNIKAIIGLVRFSLNINNIVTCASNNDPYADAVLLQIETKFSAANNLIAENIQVLEQLLSGMEGISIQSNQSVNPIVLPVEFRTVYGFIGARLLGQYDKLVRLGLVAKHVGLIFKDDWSILVKKVGKHIRELFWLSTRYRYTGVTRDDVAANNEVARRAVTKYGELPQDIMEGTRRAKHAPPIWVKSALSEDKEPETKEH